MKKRFWALFLAIMMVVSVLPTTAFADMRDNFVTINKEAERTGEDTWKITLTIETGNIEIKPEPMDLVILMDTSYSMKSDLEGDYPGRGNHNHNPNEVRMEIAGPAAQTLIKNLASAGINARVAVVTFDSGASTKKGLTQLTDENLYEITSAIPDTSDETSRGVGTNMTAGLNAAAGIFTGSNIKNKVIVMLGDGEPYSDSGGNNGPSDSTLATIKNAGITVHTIGFAIDSKVLENIAKKTNGNYYTTSSVDGLAGIFTDIKNELVAMVSDDMRDKSSKTYVSIQGAPEVPDGSSVSVTKDGKYMSWNPADGVLGEKETAVITYTVKLDNVNNFAPGDHTIKLNGDATLSYQAGDTTGKLEFPVPEADIAVAQPVTEIYLDDADTPYSTRPGKKIIVWDEGKNIIEWDKPADTIEVGNETYNYYESTYNGAKTEEFSAEVDAGGTYTLKHYYVSKPKVFDVTYEYTGEVPANAPAVPEPKEVSVGELYTVADKPTLNGYIFDGWSKTGTFTMPAEDVTITGSWTADAASVTWVVDELPVDTQRGVTGTAVQNPKYTAPTGYDLDGWYSDAECEQSVTPLTAMLGHITYYGKTVPKTDTAYKVEHYKQNLDGTGYELAETENLTGTTGATATATAKTYPGFTFDATVEGTVQSGTIAGDGSLVLKLYYTRNVYTVTFVDEDGTVLKDATKYAYGTPAANIVQPKTPTKADDAEYSFQFAGWSPEVADVTETVVYWATYEHGDDKKQYTFTFDANGGEWESPVSGYEMTGDTKASKVYTYLNVVEEIEEPTRASDDEYDYVFMGWYLTSEGNGKVWFVTYEGTPVQPLIIENTTVYAKWQRVPKVKEPIPVEKSGNLYINLQDENGTWLGGTDNPIIVTTDYLIAAETGEDVDYVIPATITVGENKYIYEEVVSGELSDIVDYDGENFVVVLQYTLDNLNDKEDKPTGGDGIPDKYQALVTYKVVNGTWSNGSSADIVKVFTLQEKNDDGVWADVAAVLGAMPTGMKPAAGYMTIGAWNKTHAADERPVHASVYTWTFTTRNAPDVTIAKYANKTSATVGETITYTIIVTNTGNVTLTDLVVKDVFTQGGNGETVWTIASLAPGASQKIEFSYRTSNHDVGGLKNIAVVTGKGPDGSVTATTQPVETDVYREHIVRPIRPADPTVKVKGLNSDDHVAYVVGRGEGMFDPMGKVTRAEVATIYFRLMTEEFRTEFWTDVNSFSDVVGTDWYNVAISTLENAGVIQDTVTGGEFRPNDPITRAELAVMAAQFATVTGKIPETSFKDVDKDYWAYDEIKLIECAGWIEGYRGYFRPDDNLTRAECVTIVNRMLKRGAEEDNMLEDMVIFLDNLDQDMWYYEAIQEAANSHDYTRTKVKLEGENFNGEIWTVLLDAPDWAALEQAWSQAHVE